MPGSLSPALSRLVRERAYRAGDLQKVEQRQAAIRRQVTRLIREYRALREVRKEKAALVAETDVRIKEHADLEVEAIRPICLTPRRVVARHGTFRAEIVSFLQAQDGEPIPTAPLVKHMVTKFSLPMGTAEERREVTQAVLRDLRKLTCLGAIERLPHPDDPTLRVWRWIGL